MTPPTLLHLPPWPPDRPPRRPDGRQESKPVDAAELATLLRAIAEPGADGRDRAGGLALYAVANQVTTLAAGVYRYQPWLDALASVRAVYRADRLASCAAEPAPLLAADVVLGVTAAQPGGIPFQQETDDRLDDPVAAASRVVRSATALGLTATVVAGFVDGIGELLELPAGNASCVLVAVASG